MTDAPARDAGYDDLLDAIADNAGYYLACSNDHAWLPPRRVCPTCGDQNFTEEPLPETGTVVVASTVHISPPQFSDDVPYVVALADFGPVTLTGQLPDIDPETVDRGLAVEPTIHTSETTGDRLLGFNPV